MNRKFPMKVTCAPSVQLTVQNIESEHFYFIWQWFQLQHSLSIVRDSLKKAHSDSKLFDIISANVWEMFSSNTKDPFNELFLPNKNNMVEMEKEFSTLVQTIILKKYTSLSTHNPGVFKLLFEEYRGASTFSYA
jgi:hypothetical protein